jgi:hypothetical protein
MMMSGKVGLDVGVADKDALPAVGLRKLFADHDTYTATS